MVEAEGRVAICGGGVIGAAVAYELARRGRAPVIIESDGVASGASGAAAGLLTPPAPGGDDPLDELRRVSFELHTQWASELPAASGVDYGYEHIPRAILAVTAEEQAHAEAVEARPGGTDDAPRVVDGAALAEATGWVDRVADRALILGPCAQVDPYRFTLALVTAAERLGAEVRSGRVTGVEVTNGRVAGVHLEREMLEASVAVIAMGPWSADAGPWLDAILPIEPLKGQIVRVRPQQTLQPYSVSHAGNYAVTKPGGLVYLGTTEERVGFDNATTTEARDAILEWGLRISSAFDDAELVEQTACLRPLARDQRPLIGRLPHLEGAFVATGHGRQGILMAPATGRAIADLILEGTTAAFDLAPYDPARFSA